jgi:hypothetical protein
MNMLKCISYVIFAMEAAGLLLCIIHVAEHLRLHKELFGSFARAMHNVNNNGMENALVSQQCSGAEVQGTQKFKATVNTTDRNGEFCTMVGKMGPRHVGAWGWLIIWHPCPANNFASVETDVL